MKLKKHAHLPYFLTGTLRNLAFCDQRWFSSGNYKAESMKLSAALCVLGSSANQIGNDLVQANHGLCSRSGNLVIYRDESNRVRKKILQCVFWLSQHIPCHGSTT